jgi:hypothetical protein
MPKRVSRRSKNQRRRRTRRTRNYRGGDVRMCPKCNQRSLVCDTSAGMETCNCQCGYYENQYGNNLNE